MTTKFSPGDRVLCFDSPLSPFGRKGTVTRVFETSVDVRHDDTMLLVIYHPKQLRRLVKRKRVVWESEQTVVSAINSSGGRVMVTDAITFSEAIAAFIGKRVRIEITEAKPQDKGER